jgi:hypothetical protein
VDRSVIIEEKRFKDKKYLKKGESNQLAAVTIIDYSSSTYGRSLNMPRESLFFNYIRDIFFINHGFFL